MRCLFASFLVMVAGPARADPYPGEERFLAVRGGHELKCSYDGPTLAHVPKALGEMLKLILRYYDDAGVEYTPSKFYGFACDLNEDGSLEYIISNPKLGGSGGPGWEVFSEFKHQWKLIGCLQGSLYVFPQRKGWARILEVVRGGGGSWAKVYKRYEAGEYNPVFSTHFERGEITTERRPR